MRPVEWSGTCSALRLWMRIGFGLPRLCLGHLQSGISLFLAGLLGLAVQTLALSQGDLVFALGFRIRDLFGLDGGGVSLRRLFVAHHILSAVDLVAGRLLALCRIFGR